MRHSAKFKLLFVVLLTGLLVASCAKEESPAERAGALARHYLSESGVAGLTISVCFDQSIAWSEGFGAADLEQKVPVNPALRGNGVRVLFRGPPGQSKKVL